MIPRASAAQQVLQSVAATIEWTNRDQNGEATAAAGTVTVGVVNTAGTTVLAAGSSTGSGATTGVYTRALTATHTASLDIRTATWTDGGDSSTHTQKIEVVGGYFFSLSELRQLAGIDDTDKFTDARCRLFRRYVENVIETWTDVAWVPRYASETYSGNGLDVLNLRHTQIRSVRSVTIDGTAATLSAFNTERDTGLCEYSGGTFAATERNNVIIGYEHGFDAPPEDLKTAAMQACQYLLLDERAGLSPRAIQVDGEFGSIRYSTASSDRPFGLPDVDAVVMKYSQRVPGFA